MLKKFKTGAKKHVQKTKKTAKSVKKPRIVEKTEKQQDEQSDDLNDYDSMIENGTDEDIDGSLTVQNVNGTAQSDNGFLENEQESAKPPNLKTQQPNNKRKIDKTTSKVIVSTDANKKPKLEKVKAPTLEEINELKETRNLFHSNLFRLQVKEMLTEIKIKDKYTKFINNWLDLLKVFIKEIPSAAEKEDVSSIKWMKNCPLQLPLNLKQLGIDVAQQKNYQFQFIKPQQEPFFVGAAATQTLLGPKLVADIAILMPTECFQKENYLNLVYDQKRALYLIYLAWQLLDKNILPDVQLEHFKFNYYNNNPLKPLLEITPPSSNGSVASKLIVRIFIAADEKCFKLNRFVPWNSNIRAVLFDDLQADEESVPTATPNYNANVLFDLTMQRNQKVLQEVLKNQKNFQEGLVLLKVWLRQRQLNVGFGGFTSHMLSMFLVYLQKQRKLHANMSSYQLARTVWNHLALSTWEDNQKGISLYGETCDQPNQPTLEQFHAYYPIVFVDSTGYYNICANLSLEMYQRVRMECKLAIDLLNDMKLNSFQMIFMTKYPLYMQVDHVLKINNAEAIDQLLEIHVEPADKCNYAGYAFPQVLKVVTRLLKKGLDKRVHALLPIEQFTEAWPAQQKPTAAPKHLHLGIILNPEHAFEVLDKGPESISESAAEFRRFWGPKAELRRFQDGTITESVVWGTSKDTLLHKRLVVRSIILHLLQYHFQLELKDIAYVSDTFDLLYKLNPMFKVDRLERYNITKEIDAAEATILAVRAFDDLARRLQGLSELPLEIVSIASYSPVFRCCDPEPILPQSRIINDEFFANKVLHGVIQLGISGKWPDELTALRALKVAFYLQIAQLLREKCKLAVKVTYDGLLIMKQGYCFNLELAHPKEVALLKREVSERGITQYVDCEASMTLEKRQYMLPKVTGALYALHQQYPSFGPTVMIAKRWLWTQLIDDGLWPDECTELLVASMFLKSHAQQITAAPQVGFIRFLQLLATTNWRTELFLLNFNNSMNESAIAELEQSFNERRDDFPLVCIATSYDQPHYGRIWSSPDRPNTHILARVTRLAQLALKLVETSLLATDEIFINPEILFKASNEGYDLVIQIKSEEVSSPLARDFGSPFVAFSKPNWRLHQAGSNHLKEAVRMLREGYSEYAAFFYNPCGGKEIGVIWKPADTFAEKPFKVNDVNGCSLSRRDPTKVQCLKETLIEDFKFILKDYCQRIETVDRLLRDTKIALKYSRMDRYFSKSIATQDQPQPIKAKKFEKKKWSK